MKKFLPVILLASLFSCKKTSQAKSDERMVSYTLTTNNINNYQRTLDSTDNLACFVEHVSGSSRREWRFGFLPKGGQYPSIGFSLEGNFPNNDLSSLAPYNLSSKDPTEIGFSAYYRENSTSGVTGRDSAFFNLTISKYRGGLMSGTFNFRVYDGGDYAIVNNGSFQNIPVTVF